MRFYGVPYFYSNQSLKSTRIYSFCTAWHMDKTPAMLSVGKAAAGNISTIDMVFFRSFDFGRLRNFIAKVLYSNAVFIAKPQKISACR